VRSGTIRLTEYQRQTFPADALDQDTVRLLSRDFAAQVAVTPPSFLNHDRWELTSLGYVGQIPVSPDLRLVLEPKVPLANLFQMLEYAYRLARFEHGLVSASSFDEVYQHLAVVLAKRVLDRARQGFYRAYVPRAERTPYVRGRLDLSRLARAPWQPRIDCHYQEHTADIEDNRILAWTLYGVLRTGICDGEGQRVLRQAYQQVRHHAALEPLDASACENRAYHRLNDDYRQLHGLCHFFLDGSGPTHRRGEHTMVPFLVDMARLFEGFVAEWLGAHMPTGFRVVPHYRVNLSEHSGMYFDIDLVVWDERSNVPLCVLDTKHMTDTASPNVHQIVAYAQAVGCRYAFLVYPTPLAAPVQGRSRDILIGSLAFDLNGDLDAAGREMLSHLAAHCPEFGSALAGHHPEAHLRRR
jgi:5-methylcytosine-specific restriction enzyme subunit McrC